jgi:hypothetical protein
MSTHTHLPTYHVHRHTYHTKGKLIYVSHCRLNIPYPKP